MTGVTAECVQAEKGPTVVSKEQPTKSKIKKRFRQYIQPDINSKERQRETRVLLRTLQSVPFEDSRTVLGSKGISALINMIAAQCLL